MKRFFKNTIVLGLIIIWCALALCLIVELPKLALIALLGGALVALGPDTKIKVKYFDPSITPLKKISVGDWID